MTTLRVLASAAFVVFCVMAAACWMLGAGPWWLPFAVTGFIMGVIGGALLILAGPSVFKE